MCLISWTYAVKSRHWVQRSLFSGNCVGLQSCYISDKEWYPNSAPPPACFWTITGDMAMKAVIRSSCTSKFTTTTLIGGYIFQEGTQWLQNEQREVDQENPFFWGGGIVHGWCHQKHNSFYRAILMSSKVLALVDPVVHSDQPQSFPPPKWNPLIVTTSPPTS